MVPPLRRGDGVFPPLPQRGRVRVGASVVKHDNSVYSWSERMVRDGIGDVKQLLDILDPVS